MYERVLRTQQVEVERVGDGARMIVPVTDRGDAIGLLEMTLPRYPDSTARSPTSAARRMRWPTSSSPRGSTPTCSSGGSGPRPFALAAEIQRRLLPAAYTCEAGQFTLAGWLEPASLGRRRHLRLHPRPRTLQVSITDAVGHQVAAALLATLSSAVCATDGAGARPRRAGPVRQRRLTENAAAGQFVTGQLAAGGPADRYRGDRQRRAPLPPAAARRPGGGDRPARRGRRSASCRARPSTSRSSRSSRATGSCC